MKNDDKICTCDSTPVVTSLTTLYCGRCEGRFLSSEIISSIDAINQKETNLDASQLPEGRFEQSEIELNKSKEDVAGSNFQGKIARREFFSKINWWLKAITASFLASELNYQIHNRISNSIETNKSIEEIEFSDISQIDIYYLDRALKSGHDLSQISHGAHKIGKHAFGLLVDALKTHTEGNRPREAVQIYSQLLNLNPAAEVKEYLLFRRSKAFCASGLVEKGIKDLDELLSLPKIINNPKKRLEYIRQCLNHNYTILSNEEVSNPNSWTKFKSLLKTALDTIEINSVSQDNFDQITKKACQIDFSLGPGTLIFEAIYFAEQNKHDKNESLRALNWHLDLIRLFEKEDQINGWNRYTPLASQAIRIGQLEFAQKVLDEASRHPQAKKLENIQGIEWLLHRAIWAILMLKHGKKSRAATILRGLLDPKLSDKLWPWYRQLSAYAIKSGLFSKSKTQMIDTRVGAMNLPALTHAAYFPEWNEFLWNN